MLTMLVSAILSATISYHSFFKVQASCLSQLYAQMRQLHDSIENIDIDKVNNVRILALCLALLFKLAIALLLVAIH